MTYIIRKAETKEKNLGRQTLIISELQKDNVKKI